MSWQSLEGFKKVDTLSRRYSLLATSIRVAIAITPTAIPSHRIDRPEQKAIAPMMAIITPVEPRSLCSAGLATIKMITAKTIKSGRKVLLRSFTEPSFILSTRNAPSQTINANLIISAIWNDRPPICIHRAAPLTSSPNKTTASEPRKAKPTNALRNPFKADTGNRLQTAKAPRPKRIAMTCFMTK